MSKANKNIITSIIVVLLSTVSVLAITAVKTPSVDDFWVMAVILFLIYVISAALIYIILILMHGSVKKSNLAYSLLFGCFPPAMLMLVSLRQAGLFDILIIFATASIILWYATYKS